MHDKIVRFLYISLFFWFITENFFTIFLLCAFLLYLNITIIWISDENENELVTSSSYLDKMRYVESTKPVECGICFDELFEGMGLSCACKVIYHADCLKSWLNISRNCPVCRNSL